MTEKQKHKDLKKLVLTKEMERKTTEVGSLGLI